MSPESAVTAPDRILIKVDLPAPFSPTRASTRPTCTVSSADRMARTAPKRFAIPAICSRGVPGSRLGDSLPGSWWRSVGCCCVPAGGDSAGVPPRVDAVVIRSSAGARGRTWTGCPWWPPRPRLEVVVPGGVLGEGQGLAHQQDLGAAVVGDVVEVAVAHLLGGLELLVLRQLLAGPGGETAQGLGIPQDAGRRRSVLEVLLHVVGRAHADREDLPDLPGVLHGLGDAWPGGGADAEETLHVRMGVHQVGRHLGRLRHILTGINGVDQLGIGIFLLGVLLDLR